jgi:hypothetical protein
MNKPYGMRHFPRMFTVKYWRDVTVWIEQRKKYNI